MIAGLLPIGTVVSLEGIKPKIMVIGYMPTEVGNPDNKHEYSGLLYPLGYRSADQIIQFDAKQICRIHFVGLQIEEQMEFEQYLMDLIEDTEEGDDEFEEDE